MYSYSLFTVFSLPSSVFSVYLLSVEQPSDLVLCFRLSLSVCLLLTSPRFFFCFCLLQLQGNNILFIYSFFLLPSSLSVFLPQVIQVVHLSPFPILRFPASLCILLALVSLFIGLSNLQGKVQSYLFWPSQLFLGLIGSFVYYLFYLLCFYLFIIYFIIFYFIIFYLISRIPFNYLHLRSSSSFSRPPLSLSIFFLQVIDVLRLSMFTILRISTSGRLGSAYTVICYHQIGPSTSRRLGSAYTIIGYNQIGLSASDRLGYYSIVGYHQIGLSASGR